MRRVWLILILLAGFFLRVHELGRENFWLDESYGWGWVVNSTWTTVWGKLLYFSDVSPVFYLLNKLCLPFFGASEFGFRLPSALIGWLVIGVMYSMGRELFNVRVGLVTAMIIALSPFTIWHARDARPYSLYLLFGALVLLGFWRAERGKGWGVFIIASLIWSVIHYFSFFFICSQFIYLVLANKIKTKFLLSWLVAQALAGMPVFLWMLAFMLNDHLLAVNTWIQRPQFFAPLQTLWVFFTNDSTTSLPSLILGGVILAGLMVLGGRQAWRHEPLASLLLICWTVFPSGLLFFVSYSLPAYVDRYLTPALVSVALLVSLGLTQLPRLISRAAIFILGGCLILGALRVESDPLFYKPRWREVARQVVAENLPLMVIQPETQIVIAPYLKGPLRYLAGRDESELNDSLQHGAFLLIVFQYGNLSDPITSLEPIRDAPLHFKQWLAAHPKIKTTLHKFYGAWVVRIDP